MSPITIDIKAKEWFVILAIGLFFAISLSMLSYFLTQMPLNDGFYLGLILGLTLFFCSLVFTSILNVYVLPQIKKTYWFFIAGLSSFLAGFTATINAYIIATFLHVKLISSFENHFLLLAVYIGLMSGVIAFLLYQFVQMGYTKDSSEKLLIQSRLKSLERQLNPHFLFNALNSLAELLHVDMVKAEHSLLQLSDFLRSSMNEKALITLEDEMDNVTRYIALENIRFDNKIHLHVNIDPSLLKYQIPKFSIQLLVENSIKHGFKPFCPLTITVQAHLKNMLEITVQNDGRPITDIQFGIGLKNLQERLNILCKGKLELHCKEPPTFRLCMKEILCES